MIKSLAHLEKEIAKGQQFEKRFARGDEWTSVDITRFMLTSIINLIGQGRLRVKQVKGQVMNELILKPCPFCGGAGEMSETEPSTARFNEGAVNFAVQCFGFDCQGVKANIWQISPEDAAKAWNKRFKLES